MAAENTVKRIKVVTSHAGHARLLAEFADDTLGYIPRREEIPSPYAYSPSHAVSEWGGRPVIVVETRHRRYEVFEVTGPIWDNDLCQGDPIGEGLTP